VLHPICELQQAVYNVLAISIRSSFRHFASLPEDP